MFSPSSPVAKVWVPRHEVVAPILDSYTAVLLLESYPLNIYIYCVPYTFYMYIYILYVIVWF